LVEDDKIYLYTGSCGYFMKDRIGAMCTVLGKDMLTVEEDPKVIVPGSEYTLSEKEVIEAVSKIKEKTFCSYELCSVKNWEGYKNHGFFEASSIRKINDTYYFVFSSHPMHELCYATSKQPNNNFFYRGVIVSNCDLNIDSYKPLDMPTAYGGNNHGGMEKIMNNWYIFYHRHTNGTWYSRQGCAEKIKINEDGTIPQVEITSCGLNNGPLNGKGEYPVYIACNIFTDKPSKYAIKGNPRIVQEGRDMEDGTPFEGIDKAEDSSYITDLCKNTTIGFKYFDFKGVKKVSIITRGYMKGDFEVRTKWDGPLLGKINLKDSSNFWEEHSADIDIPDGVSPFYLKFVGDIQSICIGQIKSIKFE